VREVTGHPVAAASRGDAQVTLGLAHELGHGVEWDVLRAGWPYRSAAAVRARGEAGARTGAQATSMRRE
jgi:TPR repeat protein